MATVYLILALLIAIIAVIFALQNTATVTIGFFAWQVTGSLSLVLLVTLAIDVVIGFLFLAPSAVKSSFQVSGHRKHITSLEKELADHRATVQRLTDEKQKPAGGASEAAPAKPK